MDFGILLSDLNGRLKTMDKYNYNFGITINAGRGIAWPAIPNAQGIPNTYQRMDAQEYDRSRLIIEPILAEPMDYVYLATLPKRAKVDDSLIKSSIPDTVMDSLREPHKVLVYDDMGALTNNKKNTLLLQTPTLIPTMQAQAQNVNKTLPTTNNNIVDSQQTNESVDMSSSSFVSANSSTPTQDDDDDASTSESMLSLDSTFTTLPVPPPPPPPIPSIPQPALQRPTRTDIEMPESSLTRAKAPSLTNQIPSAAPPTTGQLLNIIKNNITYDEELRASIAKRRSKIADDDF